MNRLKSLFARLLLPVVMLTAPALAHCAEQTATAAPTPAPAFKVEVADIEKSAQLVKTLKEKGLDAVVHDKKSMWVVGEQNNTAVWIGKNVPLAIVRTTLLEAMSVYPYLAFFHLVGDRGEVPPESVNNTIHIGGSMEAALVKKLNIIKHDDLKAALARVKTIEEFHSYLHERNIPKVEEKEKEEKKEVPAKQK